MASAHKTSRKKINTEPLVAGDLSARASIILTIGRHAPISFSEIRELTGHSVGTLTRRLAVVGDEGLVKVEEDRSQSDVMGRVRARVMYSLTDSGMKEFLALRERLRDLSGSTERTVPTIPASP